jgi:CxxC motif-containing protein (DUF1111 family)
MRMPPSLLHISRLDEIPDYVFISHARSKGDGIQGRINYVETKGGKKIGRYGWKAEKPALKHMVADALNTELGLENPYTIENERTGTDPGNGYTVEAITQYLKQL